MKESNRIKKNNLTSITMKIFILFVFQTAISTSQVQVYKGKVTDSSNIGIENVIIKNNTCKKVAISDLNGTLSLKK